MGLFHHESDEAQAHAEVAFSILYCISSVLTTQSSRLQTRLTRLLSHTNSLPALQPTRSVYMALSILIMLTFSGSRLPKPTRGIKRPAGSPSTTPRQRNSCKTTRCDFKPISSPVILFQRRVCWCIRRSHDRDQRRKSPLPVRNSSVCSHRIVNSSTTSTSRKVNDYLLNPN